MNLIWRQIQIKNVFQLLLCLMQEKVRIAVQDALQKVHTYLELITYHYIERFKNTPFLVQRIHSQFSFLFYVDMIDNLITDSMINSLLPS